LTSRKSGAAHKQRAPVLAAQHAGEHVQSLGGRDLIDDLAPASHSRAARAGLVGGPDIAVRVKRGAVGSELQLGEHLLERAELGGRRDLRPDAAVAHRAIGGQSERGVAGARGLAHDQSVAARRDHRPVREQHVRGQHLDAAVGIDAHQLARRGVGEALQIEAELAHVRAPAGVHDHVVEVPFAVRGQVGMHGDLACGGAP
jgi:hypothetical protein